MSWRIVSIAEKSYLSLNLENLVIKQDSGEFKVPLEDISVIVLENRTITTSVALLDACIQHKIAVLICDEKHTPSGTLLGYQQHSRQSKVIKEQLLWTEPLKKRVWQSIIKQKLENQYAVLTEISKREFPNFINYTASVNSGDTLNREALAARLYFGELLPKGCVRNSDHVINASLNYGYAILRGAMARSIVTYGFLSSIGIQHKNELNNYSLADDLMEVYRPYVDYLVFTKISVNAELLNKEMRNELVGILTHRVIINESKQTILRAMEITAQSLVTVTTEKDPSRLLLPILKYGK